MSTHMPMHSNTAQLRHERSKSINRSSMLECNVVRRKKSSSPGRCGDSCLFRLSLSQLCPLYVFIYVLKPQLQPRRKGAEQGKGWEVLSVPVQGHKVRDLAQREKESAFPPFSALFVLPFFHSTPDSKSPKFKFTVTVCWVGGVGGAGQGAEQHVSNVHGSHMCV